MRPTTKSIRDFERLDAEWVVKECQRIVDKADAL